MTTRPASTTDLPRSGHRKRFLAVLVFALTPLLCASCGNGLWLTRRSAGPTGALGQQADRQDPAPSGSGQWLASLVQQNGTPSLLLQEQPSGRRVPLPGLRGLTPHRSPSLSWNGRYLALLVQRGPRRLAVVQDRASGRLHRLALPPGLALERLSLAPDGRRLAVGAVDQGRPRVLVFDLSALLEPDLPPAQAVRGPVGGTEGP